MWCSKLAAYFGSLYKGVQLLPLLQNSVSALVNGGKIQIGGSNIIYGVVY